MKKHITYESLKSIIPDFLLRLFVLLFCCATALIFISRNDIVTFPVEIIVVLLLCIIFVSKHEISNFGWKIFAISFAIRVLVVLSIKTSPVSDFATMFEAAQQLVNGKFDLSSTTYFKYWAYQTGFVLYEVFILKIWNSIWALKIMNCVFSAGITWLIYKIARQQCKNEKAAQVVSILYAIFAFSVVHVTVLSNCHSSAFFLILSIYFLINKKNEKPILNLFLSAIFLAIGNILRPDGIIVLVSIIIYLLFLVVENFTWKNVKKQLTHIILFVFLYTAIVNSVAGIIKISGINSNGLDNGNPLWKFVLGFNYETSGEYSHDDRLLIKECLTDYGGDLEQVERSIVKERIQKPLPQIANLFMEKIKIMWWGTGGVNWSFSNLDFKCGKIQDILQRLTCSEIWLMMLCVVLGIYKWSVSAKKNKSVLLIPFIFFSAFVVYLFVEVQPRYAYLPQIAIFILSASGIDVLIKWLSKKTNFVSKM